MKKFALAAALAVSTIGLGAPVQAMPALQPSLVSGDIVQVAGGCGPGGHRTPDGRCAPNFRRPFYRACPPGMHLGRFGHCRPNY